MGNAHWKSEACCHRFPSCEPHSYAAISTDTRADVRTQSERHSRRHQRECR